MSSKPRSTPTGFGWTFWSLVVFSIISGIAIVFLIVAHVRETSEAVALQHARDITRALTVFRSVYSSEVVSKLDGTTVSVVHDYRGRDNAVPLPATLSIDLAERLSEGGESDFRLVSNHPFPWRASRTLSTFEQDALAAIAEAPEGELHTVLNGRDGPVLAYARAVTLGESCVACHNQRSDSPKRDWSAGDVRGIQVVTVPIAAGAALASPGILRIGGFLAVGFLAAISLVGLLVKRSRRDIVELERERHRAEDNAVRVRTVLESTVDAIVTIDEQGTIESVNPAVERIFGYGSEQLIGRNVAILMPEEHAGRHDSYIERFKKTGESRIIGIGREVLGRRVDGSTFPVELSISEFYLGDKRMFTGIMRDITARKDVERKIREAETRLVEAIEALPDGFVLYDADDRLVICNARYKDIYSTSAEFIRPGERFETIIREGASRGQYGEAGSDVEAWIAERLRAHRKPGEALEQKLDNGRWLRIIERRTDSGQTVGFRVDITELKEREEALRRSQELLTRSVNAALDAIIMIDHRGKVLEFNPAAESMFGFRREEAIGKEMAELIVPSRYRDAHRKGMETFLDTGEGPVIGQKIQIEGLHASGRELLIELAIQEAVGQDGPIFIGYARDITVEKANEQALVEAKERAEVASSAKARFLAMMSHEIRTPLNGVLGILNLLRETNPDDKQLSLIKTARVSGKSLLAIINDILDFSKLEAGQMILDRETFLVEGVLKGVADLIGPLAAHKNLKLETTIDRSVPEACAGDQGRLRQILLNLASNAVKFTEQGSIEITVSAEPLSEKRSELTFRVTDSGIGIAEDKQAFIFSEFTTIDPGAGGKLEGTGLGLAISKSLVEAMDGRIGYDSTEGRGSTFWFSVPLTVANAADAVSEDEEDAALPPLPEGLRLLLAEDNMTNQLVVGQMLEEMGCLVDLAADGLEAVEAARKRPYDAVLMDISMPEMDGIEATQAIRAFAGNAGQVPIIALTAYALPEDRERFLAAGIDQVITKPVERHALARALGDVAARPPIDDANDRAEPIDTAALQALLAGQSPEMRERMIGQFQTDLSNHLERLRAALDSGDLEALERSSHVLKSLGGTFAAIRLAELAEATNGPARRGDAPEAFREVAQLIEECGRVADFLQQASALAPTQS